MAQDRRTDQLELDLHFRGSVLTGGILRWYESNQASHPWRQDWQRFRDPYHVWVSEIMLQQTLISVVSPVYRDFVKRFPDVVSLAAADESEIRQAVRGLGYYRRFALMHKAAKALVTEGRGEIVWPRTFSELKRLPGVGDYTAAALASIAFDVPVPVIDGNVERVMCRIFNLQMPGNLPRVKKAFFETLLPLVSPRAPGDFNQGMMELGQLICTPATPKCGICPVQRICLANQHATQHLAPAPKVRQPMIPVDLQLVVLKNKGKIGIAARPAMAKFLKGTSGFITYRKDASGYCGDGFVPKGPRPDMYRIGSVRHSITNHSISAEVYLAEAQWAGAEFSKIQWLSPNAVELSLVSNLDRKAWRLVERNFDGDQL